jgi:tetratricopeptide (TPR) repeat protein
MNWLHRAQRAPQKELKVDDVDYGGSIPWPHTIGVFPGHPLLRQQLQETPAERLDRKINAWRREDMRIVSWDPFRKARLLKIGQLLLKRFDITGSISDLNAAIDELDHAARRSKPTDNEWVIAKAELAFALSQRFDESKSIDDLDRAISTRRDLKSYMLPEGLELHQYLLSFDLRRRFEVTGSFQDSSDAVEMLQAIAQSAADLDKQAQYQNELSLTLQARFQKTQVVEDLRRGIEAARYATRTKGRRTEDSELAGYFSTLGKGLSQSWSWISVKTDLRDAIAAYEQALRLISSGNENHTIFQSNLAVLLRERFEVDGRWNDLKRSLEFAQNAVNCTPNGDIHRASRLTNLANALHTKWETTGLLEDLESAIQSARSASECAPEDGEHRGPWYGCLCRLLQARFQLFGSIEDLDEATEVGEIATAGLGFDGDGALLVMLDLANAYQRRYDWLQSTDALERAIKLYGEALLHDMMSDFRASFYTNLSSAFTKRYRRFRDKSADTTDLTRSIDAAKNAIRFATAPTTRAMAQMALARSLQAKARNDQDVKALDEAIKAYENVLEAAPKNLLGAVYNNLGSVLDQRYNGSKSMKDLKYMVATYKKALSETPEGHPDRYLYMSNLGRALAQLARHKNSSRKKRKAIDLLSKSALDPTLPVSIQIETLVRTANLLAQDDIQRVTECLTLATKLMPILSSRAVATIDWQFRIANFPQLACSAAAWVLDSNKPAIEAIEVLEIGRGVIMSGYFEMRSDLTYLKELHPVLGHHFEQLQLQLDPPSSGFDTCSIRSGSIKNSHFIGASQSRLVERYEEMLREIRALPGFDRFLLGQSRDELVALAHDGPIIILNTHPNRCDAIIVNKEEIYALPLPTLRFEIVQEKSKVMDALLGKGRTKEANKDLREILEWLWDTVAKPVLANLDFNSTPAEGSAWPKIWWIPTGSLTLFPIHAAGYHAINSQETVMDRVVSRYATTIKSLTYARKRKERVRTESQPSLLLVPMPETSGAECDLPQAGEEVSAIANMMPKSVPTQILHQPKRSQVLEALSTHSMAHFACHGRFDIKDPLQSMLMLTDWESKPLSVGDIVSLQLDNVAFAYISACHSANNQDLDLIDEGIHLAGALQLAGYPQVVATLWSVADAPSKRVSELVYTSVVEEGLGALKVAEALNNAVRRLRDESRYEDGCSLLLDDEPLVWAPYIFMGA